MSPTFTTDDVGKTVESAEGEALGIIASVDDETAYVEPDPDVTDSIRATLNWESSPGDAVPLPDESVHRVTDDAIRLESSFPEGTITSSASESEDTGDESVGGSGEQNVDDSTEVTGESTAGARPTDVDESGEMTRANLDEPEGPSENDLDDSDTMMDDERYETVDDGPRTDPGEELRDPEAVDPDEASDRREDTEEAGSVDDRGERQETTPPDELDSVEDEASRGMEVDPTELTDDDPEAEINPGEDVAQRTDARVDPEDIRDEGDSSGGPTTEDGEEE